MRKALLGLAALMLPVAAEAAVRAVFVGIDQYQFSRDAGVATAGFDDLKGAVADTRTIKAALARTYGLALDAPAQGQCRSGNATSITLTDRCATKAAIMQAWASAIEASQPGDTLILYFAGHGSRFIDDRALDQASRYNSTLMAADARQPGALTNADILDFEVRAVIDGATAKGVRVVTWFDSCNSGTASRDASGRSASRTAPDLRVSGLRQRAAPRQYGIYGAYRVHLAAAGDGQDAKEVGSVGLRAGVFTSALASALQAMPRASFADIAARVVADVSRATRRSQVPHAEGALRATLDGPEIKVPTFDVVLDRGQLLLSGGALVGITPGSVFAIFAGTSAAVQGGDAPLLRARVAQVAPGLALLAPEGPLPAGLAGRLVAREERHGFGNLRLGLAVSDPAALAVVQQLGFVAVNPRGPFALRPEGDGLALRGRGGTLLAMLPAADAPDFGVRLAAALEKIARVEAWLNVVRPRPGISLCVTDGPRQGFDPASCPRAPRTPLRSDRPAFTSVINETSAPRFAYVLVVDEKYGVTLVMPGFGAVDRDPLPAGQPLVMPAGQELHLDPGNLRFVALSSDVPLNAAVLEQTATDVADITACLSAVARAFCLGDDASRAGRFRQVTNWSAAATAVGVVP